MMKLWSCLEELPGLRAVPAMWRGGLGDEFNLVRAAFLRTTGTTAASFPCPHECGCTHSVVVREDQTIVGVCTCESWNCDDIPLRREEIGVLELSWTKLGRALAKAFGCDARDAECGCANMRQVAVFSSAAMPIFLSLQPDAPSLHQTVAQVIARQRNHFVVLVPTNRFVDAPSRELLRNASAGLVALEPVMSLAPNGVLRASKSAGDLFSAFLPEMREAATDDEARSIFAIAKTMSPEGKVVLAPPFDVLRLYCVENLSRNEIAKRCGCAPSLVSLRFRELERQFQRPMKSLRTLSDSFARVADSLSDPRARHIHRKSAIDEGQFDEH